MAVNDLKLGKADREDMNALSMKLWAIIMLLLANMFVLIGWIARAKLGI